MSSISASASAVSELGGRADAVGDGRRERVVVQAAWELPNGTRSERVRGLDAEHELLEVVQTVERGHRPCERAGRGSVDPAHTRPQPRLVEPLQEAELQEHAVDPAAREDERDVATVGVRHEVIVPPWRSCARELPVLTDLELESEEELWEGDDDGDHGGWYCVRTDPFPCPAGGCSFVADFMTAAHLVLVWEERDDPNLLWHAQRAKEVGRNPRIVGYESAFGPSASYYAWEAAGRPVHGVKR